MPQLSLHVRTADGATECQLFRPDGAGPWPAIIFYSDAFGVRPETEAMAARLSSHGYAVLLPNLLYRAGAFAPFDQSTVWTDPTERARLMAIVVPAAQGAISDTAAYLAALSAQPDVKADRVGAVGYCLGGRVGLLAAAAYPDRFAAVAAIHAGGLVNDTPASPHRQVDKVKARVYFAVADQDAGCTPEHQATLKAALDAATVRYELEQYPGAKHGFAVNGTHVYDQAAAEKHWRRIVALFAETLRA